MYKLTVNVKESKTNFLGYTGYLYLINDRIKQDLLVIQVSVPLVKFPSYLTFCLTAIKCHVIRYCEKV